MKCFYLVVLLTTFCSLQTKAEVTLDQVEKITSKIEMNTTLKKEERKNTKKLVGKYPDSFSESTVKKLLKIAENGRLSSNHAGSPTQRREIVKELKQFVVDKRHIECFEKEIKQTDYHGLEAIVNNYLLILEKEISKAVQINFFRPLCAELNLGIKYGIPEIIERIIALNRLQITQNSLKNLETAESKAYDCPWFNSRANFERCRELLEAKILKNI